MAIVEIKPGDQMDLMPGFLLMGVQGSLCILLMAKNLL